jgi:hypothetical protein
MDSKNNLEGLGRLARGGASVHGFQNTNRLQSDVLVGAVIVRESAARLDELEHGLWAVA